MAENPFASTQCRQCGRPTTFDGITEYFELRHTHLTEGENVTLPNGITVPIPVPEIASQSVLTGIFCSATCLTEFVLERIAPGS